MNSRMSVKINLATLKCVVKPQTNKAGQQVDCLVIPIDVNKLFRGEKGGIYLDMTAFPIDPAKRHADSKDSHLLKISYPKEVYEAMSEEEKKSQPIVGNIITWDGTPAEVAATVIKEEDDLPF